MSSQSVNKLTTYTKTQIDRFRFFAKEKPKIAVPLYAAAAIIILLLISTLIALVTQEDTKQPAGTVQQSVAQITISKDGFVPASLVVKKGTKIVWTNNDQAMHQIYANPHPTGDSLPGLKSEILNNSQTYEYNADTVGTYGYHDQLNPTINGTIDVQE